MKKMKKLVIGALSATMILGMSVPTLAEDSSDLFSLEGIMGIAQEAWSALPDEDKEALVDGVQTLLADEEVQGYIGELTQNLPEEALPTVLGLISNLVMSDDAEVSDDAEGVGELTLEDLGITEDELARLPKPSTHDDILETTGIDLPVIEDAPYTLADLGDGIFLANISLISDEYLNNIFAVSGVSSVEECFDACNALEDYETLEETTYNEQTAYFSVSKLETDIALLWFDEEKQAILGVAQLPFDGEFDSEALTAFADEHFK